MSGCRLPSGRLLLQAAARLTGRSFFLASYDSASHEIDSLEHPVARIRTIGFFAQQTTIRQVDDSTCGYFPTDHAEWGLHRDGRDAVVTMGIESLPPAEMVTIPSERGAIYHMDPTARAATIDARAWRDAVIVLFEGATRQRHRLLDFYGRDRLEYRGSLVLPYRASRIAVHGDTLVVIGDEDDEPVLYAYLLGGPLRQR
jgi:hypothetical protein